MPAAILAVTAAAWFTRSTSSHGTLWSAVAAPTVIPFAGHAVVGQAERAVLRINAPEQTSA